MLLQLNKLPASAEAEEIVVMVDEAVEEDFSDFMFQIAKHFFQIALFCKYVPVVFNVIQRFLKILIVLLFQ